MHMTAVDFRADPGFPVGKFPQNFLKHSMKMKKIWPSTSQTRQSSVGISVQFVSFLCSYRQSPLGLTPLYRKSWIRHCEGSDCSSDNSGPLSRRLGAKRAWTCTNMSHLDKHPVFGIDRRDFRLNSG